MVVNRTAPDQTTAGVGHDTSNPRSPRPHLKECDEWSFLTENPFLIQRPTRGGTPSFLEVPPNPVVQGRGWRVATAPRRAGSSRKGDKVKRPARFRRGTGASPGFVPSRHLTPKAHGCLTLRPRHAAAGRGTPGTASFLRRGGWTLPPWDAGFGGFRGQRPTSRNSLTATAGPAAPGKGSSPVLALAAAAASPAPARSLPPPAGPPQSRGCRGRVRPSRERGAGGRAGREDGGGEGAPAAGGGAARRLRGAGGRRGPLYQHRVHPGGESPPVHRGARTPRPRRRPRGPPLPSPPRQAAGAALLAGAPGPDRPGPRLRPRRLPLFR